MARRGLLPTPVVSASANRSQPEHEHGNHGAHLSAVVIKAHRGLLATPTVDGNYNRSGASPSSGDGLATQMGGRLNPRFLEWMMGLPDGWTENASAVTRSSRKPRR
jgi:hypothetical protein